MWCDGLATQQLALAIHRQQYAGAAADSNLLFRDLIHIGRPVKKQQIRCENEAVNISTQRPERIGSADGSCSLDAAAGYGQVVCINGLWAVASMS